MKKILLLLIVLPYSCFSQFDMTFPNYISVDEVIQSKDSSSIVLLKGDYGGSFFYSHLKKIGNDGSIVWEKTYGGQWQNMVINSIDTCYDAGFILGGNSFIMKINENGDSLWSIPFSNGIDIIKSTMDSCFLAFDKFGSGAADNMIYKIDSLGSILYQIEMEDSNVLPNYIGWISINDILPTDDGVVVVGTYENYNNPMGGLLFGGYLAKFNNQGTHQWTQEFSGWYYDYMHQVINTTDGGYAVIASSESFCSNNDNIASFWLIKTDALGTIQWQNHFACNKISFGSPVSFGSFGSGYIMATTSKGSSWSGAGDTTLIIIADSVGNEINSFDFVGLTDPRLYNNILSGYSPDPRVLLLDFNSIGCTDPMALNYDSTSNLDNGSCVYGKTYVPDDNFEYFLEMNGMGDSITLNDSVYTQSITDITYLNVENSYITDLTGLEDFLSLQNFQCGGNDITSLDLSQNTDLTYLYCNDNQLTSLDVTANLNLIQFQCGDNQLTSLDISNNTTLQSFGCYNNQLTSLDVSQNTALNSLNCTDNQLTSLDVSANTALTTLSCSANQLTSLDVSNNTALTNLDCWGNILTSLDFRNINILNCNLYSFNNQNLYCIDVDNVALANIVYAGTAPTVDSWTSFSTNCATALGCTDPLALNYNSLATIDDGSCISPGCMDTTACNYDPSASIDDGSCNYPTSNSTTQTSCDTYTWNGNTYTTSGTYTNVSTNAAGCDHTETLNLTINNSTSSIDTHVACDEFMWNCDGNLYTASNNTATYTYTNAAGCDSVVTLDLTINSSSSSTDTHVACDEFMWNCDGNLYTSSNNTATYVYTNTAGCDSTVTLDLTINNSTSSTDTHVACDEFMWNCDGNLYTASNNTATYTYTNAAGCDSTVTLDLTINNSTLNTTTETVCDSYTWSVDGNTYTTSGTYTYVSNNANGCDHTETLTLIINNSTINTTNATACDTYTWAIDGNSYTTSGTYTDVSTNTDGCDHTETLELTISSVIASISQSGDNLSAVTTPIGLNANWYNIQREDSTIRIWLMEEDAPSFNPTFDCSYFIIVNDNGCTDTSEIYAYGENAARIGSFITSPNPTTGLINVKFDNPKSQFVMLELISNNGSKLDEFITIDNNLNIDLSNYPSGTYYLYFDSEDATQGCALEEVQKLSTKIILNK